MVPAASACAAKRVLGKPFHAIDNRLAVDGVAALRSVERTTLCKVARCSGVL
jgi:hypothetical protein